MDSWRLGGTAGCGWITGCWIAGIVGHRETVPNRTRIAGTSYLPYVLYHARMLKIGRYLPVVTCQNTMCGVAKMMRSG